MVFEKEVEIKIRKKDTKAKSFFTYLMGLKNNVVPNLFEKEKNKAVLLIEEIQKEFQKFYPKKMEDKKRRKIIDEINKEIVGWVKRAEVPYENKAIIKKIIEVYDEKMRIKKK